MKIGIASDHRGFKQKAKLINYLEKKGHNVINYGTDNETLVDYPDYAFTVGHKINENEIDLGILICGTGIGMSIAANKVKNVRCAKADSINDAKKARSHNDANVLALSSEMRLMKMKDIIDTFINTPFSMVDRYKRRNEKINNYGDNYEY